MVGYLVGDVRRRGGVNMAINVVYMVVTSDY